MPFYIFNRKMINQGTQDPTWCDEVVVVARPSVLGNPFPIGQGPNSTRGDVIARYRRHLWEKFRTNDPEILNELLRLGQLDAEGKNVALVCWCAPLPCHAEVVARAAGVAHAHRAKPGSDIEMHCVDKY